MSENAAVHVPGWAQTAYRIWILVQAATLTVSSALALLFDFTRPSSCSEMCDLTLFFNVAIAGFTLLLAACLVAIGLGHTNSWSRLAAGLTCNLLGDCAAWLAMSAATGGDPATLEVYQFWYALPLVLWPGIAAAATLGVGLLLSRAQPARAVSVAWTVVTVMVSAYLLTYLLPATESRVAALHGQGVVILPRQVGWLIDGSGRTLTRDHDPMIRIDSGYEITLLAGRWTIKEMCVSAGDVYTERALQIDVRVGQVTTVPAICAG